MPHLFRQIGGAMKGIGLPKKLHVCQRFQRKPDCMGCILVSSLAYFGHESQLGADRPNITGSFFALQGIGSGARCRMGQVASA